MIESELVYEFGAEEPVAELRVFVCDGCMNAVTLPEIADLADGEHVLCKKCVGP